MKSNEIIKEIMKLRGFSNNSLAVKLGKSTASAISNPLSRKNAMRIDTLVEMVSAMDCEIVIRSVLKDKSEWVITPAEKDDASGDSEQVKKSKSRIKLTGSSEED